MSTRSTTHFLSADGTLVANIYRHADGYPEGHGADLVRFFDAVESDTRDTRFDDPAYLAAKLVVWLSREFATSYDAETQEWTNHADERPLDFLSVGIVSEDPPDIEYVYEVTCKAGPRAERPNVKCYAAAYGTGNRTPVDLSEVLASAPVAWSS